ncbi:MULTISPECIES: ATP phosphoribosyltransferase regulatory subunit [Deefgea]|uniref:ATP phosphoribosyltransferase regulatory subunit n=1 Tax=Deefgea chitinilytica TaxID=570276 RepID=A0ABS2CC11_9NEIS|nr:MULTISPECIES: ATP phosphoribosyltransferase regulatory subunit [Deefgea]MBM5570983.1 ATP phosphoribosyltransferase regulatory subunit [Deefgea chitinilytica]MBM9888213.1 ATP phosphoribosyltransferase regulatory subunit [Deefgea sp. CFH1-16]
MRNWILPEYISDVLPLESRQLETMRRAMLDLYERYGYEQVEPPLVEYVESLLTQDDSALDLKTFKLVDELTGRQMGLRADITPQVARIDAHILNRQGVTRLSYAGSVVTTRPDGLLANRQPRQIGAEIYGCADIGADVEAIELMLASLELAGVKDVRLEIGHIGLFNAMADAAQWQSEIRQLAFNALQQKDLAVLQQLTQSLPDSLRDGFLALPLCYGGAEVLDRARTKLPALPAVSEALDVLNKLSAALITRGIQMRFDLAELPGSYYHTGLVFNAYATGFVSAVARGGRYDRVGEKFGRSRPATGFSLDLRSLTAIPFPAHRAAILAPQGDDAALLSAISALRASGQTVIVDLGVDVTEVHINRSLQLISGQWQVVPLQ